MKKRILSLVLCAALLLSLCLFMGAGAAVDSAADMAETAGTVETRSRLRRWGRFFRSW